MSLTLTGTNFTSDYYPTGQPNLQIKGDVTGITVENLVVVNNTTITCDFVISQTATASTRNITVFHTGGTSGTQPFTVGYPSDFLVFFG